MIKIKVVQKKIPYNLIYEWKKPNLYLIGKIDLFRVQPKFGKIFIYEK